MNTAVTKILKQKLLLAITGLVIAFGVLSGATESRAAEKITFYHNDISGTPLLATDAAGNVVWKENYQPYGDKLNKQPASAGNKVGFAGKPYDGNTGLSYMGARYYDPVIGRFMGIDPKGFDEGNLHSFNRYAYANNNPYKFVDPDGRAAAAIVALLGVGLVVNEIATGDVPIIGGGLAKVGITAAERLAANKAAGTAGEAATRATLGEKSIAEQIIVITSTGERTIADFVTKTKGQLGIVETKTGGATLSSGQKQLKQDIENGVAVTPVGRRAREAGFDRGVAQKFETHTIDRPAVSQ